jgi:hypothetical protein
MHLLSNTAHVTEVCNYQPATELGQFEVEAMNYRLKLRFS